MGYEEDVKEHMNNLKDDMQNYLHAEDKPVRCPRCEYVFHMVEGGSEPLRDVDDYIEACDGIARTETAITNSFKETFELFVQECQSKIDNELPNEQELDAYRQALKAMLSIKNIIMDTQSVIDKGNLDMEGIARTYHACFTAILRIMLDTFKEGPDVQDQ